MAMQLKLALLVSALALCLCACSGPAITVKRTATQTTSTSPSTGAPGGSNAAGVEDAVVTSIQKAQPSVVEIMVQTTQGQALGSGSIITQNGFVLTNDHVVQGASTIQVTTADTSYDATVTGTDAADDLAVIKITGGGAFKAISFADSSKLRIGQFAVAMGNPLGVGQSASFGIVSALNRSVSEAPSGPANTIPNAIQTSAPINPGNSGGALIDLSGNLIGIPTLGALDPEFGGTPANGIGFAIPSNRALFIANQIMKDGKVINTGRPYMGIVTANANATNGGALIRSVVPGGPAEKAGLQAGDVIVQVDTATITDSNSLGTFLSNKAPGDKITVTVVREGQRHAIPVTLGTLPPQ